MNNGIYRKTFVILGALLLAGLFSGGDSASAQIAGVAIDGRRDIFIPPGTNADKRIGTLFKRRGDIQRFRIRNGGGTCWNMTLFLPPNFAQRIAPAPNPLQPGTTSTVTIAYLGGATPPNSTFSMLFVDCDNPLNAFVYSFELDNTPKKRKASYEGTARNLIFRDTGGSNRRPPTPITLNLPLGRGAFNGILWTAQTNPQTFQQNVRFQGRVRDFKQRRGGKKMIIEGFSRWKLQRLGFPGVARGKFRWKIRTNKRRDTVIAGRIRVSNAGNTPKSKDYSLSTRFRGKLDGSF